MKKHEKQMLNFLRGMSAILADKLSLEDEVVAMVDYITTLEAEVVRLEAEIEELRLDKDYEGRHSGSADDTGPVDVLFGVGGQPNSTLKRMQVSVGEPPPEVDEVGGPGNDPVRGLEVVRPGRPAESVLHREP